MRLVTERVKPVDQMTPEEMRVILKAISVAVMEYGEVTIEGGTQESAAIIWAAGE